MDPVAWLCAVARAGARIAHAAVSEWRKLDAPPEQTRSEINCTSASTQVAAPAHDHRRPRVTGFG
jgi:hypothetical protein